MPSELSFLLDLLLNHKLPVKTKAIVSDRIKEVESNLNKMPVGPYLQQNNLNPPYTITSSARTLPAAIASQSPSMQAIMLKNPDLIPAGTIIEDVPSHMPPPPPQPVAVIAHTAATALAMAERAKIMAGGKTFDANRGGPKKF